MYVAYPHCSIEVKTQFSFSFTFFKHTLVPISNQCQRNDNNPPPQYPIEMLKWAYQLCVHRYCLNWSLHSHSLFHDGLEVIAEVSVECVLVEGLVDDLICGRHVPDPWDEQHRSDWTMPASPLTHTQVLQQHHAVVEKMRPHCITLSIYKSRVITKVTLNSMPNCYHT